MKNIKLKIVANNCLWSSFPSKIEQMKAWFAPKITLSVDLEKSSFPSIPFTPYQTVNNVVYDGIDPVWYDKNISMNAIGYDIVLFVVNHDQWKEKDKARGWRNDRTFGPVELQICADEDRKIMIGSSGQMGDEFFGYGRHEIMHALYMLTGQEDKTHFYWDKNNLEAALAEIDFKEPKNPADTIISFEPGMLQRLIDALKGPISPVGASNKLNLWAEAIKEHEGWFAPSKAYPEGSKSYRNNNPGNLRYVGQPSATGPDKTGFCIFPTYKDGFNALVSMLKNAATGKSKVYKPTMTLLDFFRTYAPAADSNNPDAYADAVAKKIGVRSNTVISTLV